MAIFNLFSKRQKKLKGEVPTTLTFDHLPQTLKVKVVHIIVDAFGEDNHFSGKCLADNLYKTVQAALCREYGVFRLSDRQQEESKDEVLNFLLQTPDNDKVIDVIELCFKLIDKHIRGNDSHAHYSKPKIEPDDAIQELNNRFKEEGVGYSFSGGEIIRVDSTYIHSEVSTPTISLLWNKTFLGANEEFMKAHEHYRHGRNKECLSECLKAFESVLKIICKEKGWKFNQNDTSRKLIQICFQNELVPTFTQNQFTSLQNLLESGIPTIRNKLGGHGQGQIPQKVDDEMTRYGLNLTGTNIIFLIEQSQIK